MTQRQKNSFIKRAAARLEQTDFLNMNAKELDATIRQIVNELQNERKAA